MSISMARTGKLTKRRSSENLMKSRHSQKWERQFDTPVKYYSSGMYIRLAFAVAAHLEPEILLLDEVLAVGDAAFQQKCLGRMGAVAKEGDLVLSVITWPQCAISVIDALTRVSHP